MKRSLLYCMLALMPFSIYAENVSNVRVRQQGKDITPLMIEINKYRRRNNLNTEFEIKSKSKYEQK